MKVVIAKDSSKGSMSSAETGNVDLVLTGEERLDGQTVMRNK